jgi:outer membrane protein TolC
LATAVGRVTDAKRRVVVAADALRAGFDFTASASENSTDYGNGSFKLDLVGNGDYSLGFLLDLPLERTAERNAYRQSLISLDATTRSLGAFEDQVKIEVRRAERALSQARDAFRIQSRALEVSEVNVDAARLLKDAGTGTTNDLIDAQNDLIAAENAVTAALVDVHISRLELLRDLGVLVVGPQGIDEAATSRLLEED